MQKRHLIITLVLLVGGLILAACQPEEVEVTRVVEVEGETVVETVVEEVTRVVEVEGETVIETVTEEVEVTRVVTADVDPTACNLEAPAEGAEVNMIGHAFPITEFFVAELEKCNDVDNIEVNTQLLDSESSEVQQRLALSGGGESPWAITHQTPSNIVEFASQGLLTPLDDLVEKYWIEYNLFEIPKALWESASYEGHIYGVPFLGNTLHMFYRTDLFEQYNLSPPTTYDSVIAACNVLADEASM